MTTTTDAESPPRLAPDEAIAYLGGDRELYAQIVQIFLDDSLEQLATLDGALATGDVATAHRIAHTIKGTSATLGVERLRQCATVLEHACKAADQAAITVAAPAFRAELAAACAALREFIQQA